MLYDIIGQSTPSAPDAPVEADDTVRGVQVIKAIIAIGEGVIGNISNDNVYLNGTPVTAYKGITVRTARGLPNQEALVGFENVESSNPAFTSANLYSGVPITKAVSSNTISAVRLTITFSALIYRNDRGDTSGSSVTHELRRRQDSSSSWELVKTWTVQEKASNPYPIDIVIEKNPAWPAETTWEVRITRTTPDPDSQTSNAASLTSMIEIQKGTFTYPNTALVGIIARRAIRLGGTLPVIMVRPDEGRYVFIPSNYNPVTRVYDESSGTWDGSFALQKQYSPNLSWCIYDILEEARAGMGIEEGEINRFSFYEFAKYCDQLVDSGRRNPSTGAVIYERRYEVHIQLTERQDAPVVLQTLLTLGNANFSTDQFGNTTIVWDAPFTTTKLESNTTVIDGKFQYLSNNIDQRYTSVNVTYSDPDDKGNPDTITIPSNTPTEFEQTYLTRYGFNPIDIPLAGCMSYGMAIRKARWVFFTNTITTGIIVYKKKFAGSVYTIGEIVEVIDDRNQLVKQQGIVKGSSLVSSLRHIQLDRTLTLDADGLTDYILYYSATGVISAPILNDPGATDTIIVDGPQPIYHSVFLIATETPTSKWRVTSIEYDTANEEYTISATEHRAEKFDYIDGVHVQPIKPFVQIDYATSDPVTNIQFIEEFYSTATQTGASLIVTWDWDTTDKQYVPMFEVWYRRGTGLFVKLPETNVRSIEIPNVIPDIYEVVVYTHNPYRLRSEGVLAIYSYRVGPTTSSLQPPDSIYCTATGSSAFNSPDLVITILYNTANDTVADTLLDYIVEVWSTDGTTLKNTYVVPKLANKNGQFIYTYYMNTSDFGSASRNVQIRVYSRDVVGDRSSYIVETFTNAPPATVSASVIFGIGTTYIDISPNSETDLQGYVVHVSETAGFTPNSGNLAYIGAGNYVALSLSEGTKYIKVAAYDSFSRESLNYSSEYSGNPLSLNVTTWQYDSLVFKANNPDPNKVSWTAGHAVSDAGDNLSIAAGNLTYTSGILYIYHYYNGIISEIRGTTTFGIAVSDGIRVLATYKGGKNLIVGNGDSFVDGDKILAGTVGAQALIADSAVITGSIQIANSIITNAHITDLHADKITVGTLQADRIISGSLSHTGVDQYAGDISIATGTEVTVLTYDFTSNQDSSTNVLLRISVGFGCPLAITRVKLVVTTTSSVELFSTYLYFRDSQTLDQRYFSASRSVTLAVPADTTFRINLIVKQTSGSAKDINDPYIDVSETYA